MTNRWHPPTPALEAKPTHKRATLRRAPKTPAYKRHLDLENAQAGFSSLAPSFWRSPEKPADDDFVWSYFVDNLGIG